jgi:rod shape determining protein RodA
MAETVAPAWRRAVQAVDWTLLLLLVVLVSIGLIGIYSATSSSGMLQFFTRQLVSVGIGAGAFLIAALLPREWLLRIAPVFYAASIGLLGLVLLVGRTVYGSKSWLALGGMSFQPVELAKLGVILLVARLLSEEGRELQQVPVLLRFLLIVAVPMGLVLLQPDVGSATVFAALALVLLWWAGAPPLLVVLPILMAGMVLLGLVSRTAVLLGVVGAVVVVFLFRPPLLIAVLSIAVLGAAGWGASAVYSMLKPHQKARIEVFFEPERDPQGIGYHVTQSVLAIGSGGLLGKGFQQGTQTQLRYIPKQWTDFIFCVPAEEFGFVGAALLLAALFGGGVSGARGSVLEHLRCRNRRRVGIPYGGERGDGVGLGAGDWAAAPLRQRGRFSDGGEHGDGRSGGKRLSALLPQVASHERCGDSGSSRTW